MATVAENLQTIIDIKSDIKTAIENKGITVGDASFGEYAGKIDSISQSVSSWTLPTGVRFQGTTVTEMPKIYYDNLYSGAQLFLNCAKLITFNGIEGSDNCVRIDGMFSNCSSLENVALFNTSNVSNGISVFANCSSLQTIPLFNFNNLLVASGMFYECSSLQTIPSLFFGKCVDMSRAFYYCNKLTTLPLLDFGDVYSVYNTFEFCFSLENVGGFKDLGKGIINPVNDSRYPTTNMTLGHLNLQYSSKLTYQSCLNIFNNLYDVTNLGPTIKVMLHPTPYALLSEDDIAIATNKGWTVVSA